MTKNILTICDDPTGPVSLDPHKEYDMVSHNVVAQMFEGLVRFSPDGRIEPCLAERWERLDDKRVRFFLRRNVRFHNGEEFNADSVRFTVKRVTSPLTMSPALFMIKPICRAEVIDRHTVDIVTKSPDGTILHKLAAFLPMLPPGYLETAGGKRFAEHPVGTGPFRFKSRAKQDGLILERNEDYWEKGFPKLDGVVFKHVPIAEQTERLIEGELDMVTFLPEKDTLRVQQNAGTRVLKKEGLLLVGAALNCNSGPFADKRVRLALCYATNKEDIINYALKGNGRLPMCGSAMPGEIGYGDALQPYPYDPARARELLAEAGYKDGVKIKVALRDVVEDVGKMLFKQWEKAGFSVEYKVVDQAALFKKMVVPRLVPLLPRWRVDMLVSHCPDIVYHSYFISGLAFYSKGVYSVGRHAEFDRVFEDMIHETDPARHEALARKTVRFAHDEAVAIMLCQLIKVYGLRRGVNYLPLGNAALDLRTTTME